LTTCVKGAIHYIIIITLLNTTNEVQVWEFLRTPASETTIIPVETNSFLAFQREVTEIIFLLIYL